MSKKNKSNRANNRVVIPFDINKGTILNQFQTFMKQRDTVMDVIQFLAIQDAKWMKICAENHGAPAEKERELIEFYEYFMEYFDDETAGTRFMYWENDAFVLVLGAELMEKRDEELYDEHIANASAKDLVEAQLLVDTLFPIRKDRFVSYFYSGVTRESVYIQSIPKEILPLLKKEMLDACLCCIEEHGAIVVRCYDADETCDLFGIRVTSNGVWQPISKEEMLDAHTLTPDGSRMEPEEGVNYTEIKRKMYNFCKNE